MNYTASHAYEQLDFDFSAQSYLYPAVLSIPFRTVMRLAKHLAVLLICRAALAPCRNVIGVHLVQFPYLFLDLINVTHRAVRAVAYADEFTI
jgi:hypothetical protein